MNSQQRQLIIIFVFLFAVSSIAINWANISWVFNYRVVGSLVNDFFNPYENSALLISANNMTINAGMPTSTIAQSENTNNPKLYPYSEKNNSIEIPSLNITAPVIVGQSTDTKTLTKELDGGVVYYPGSVPPGENGQVVILGHSAPPNWPNIKYDWVFSNINDLTIGSQIILYFNHKQYTYRVVEKNIIQVGQDVESNRLNGKNNILTLISCWPPGKNYKRIAVQAELIEN
ncbi:MAG: class E sortase [Candidatus Staskawiczbacteria bacterium]|nr:class E sortase [Candidatus Staskawiczbacteria bacterium]